MDQMFTTKIGLGELKMWCRSSGGEDKRGALTLLNICFLVGRQRAEIAADKE